MNTLITNCETKKAKEFSDQFDITTSTNDKISLNHCIQLSINKILNNLVIKEDTMLSEDVLTYKSMDNNTLSLYNNNYIYIIVKLFIFVILGISYFYLLK